jgi:hypothetical protein
MVSRRISAVMPPRSATALTIRSPASRCRLTQAGVNGRQLPPHRGSSPCHLIIRTAARAKVMIGPDGAFGIDAYRRTPLHADPNGWVESWAPAAHAGRRAKTVTKIKGKASSLGTSSLRIKSWNPAMTSRAVTSRAAGAALRRSS